MLDGKYMLEEGREQERGDEHILGKYKITSNVNYREWSETLLD